MEISLLSKRFMICIPERYIKDKCPNFFKDLENFEFLNYGYYVLHDKCVFSKFDEKFNYNIVAGNKKPNHYHILLVLDTRMSVLGLSNLLEIPEKYVNLSCISTEDILRYFLHKNYSISDGYYQYKEEDIKVILKV